VADGRGGEGEGQDRIIRPLVGRAVAPPPTIGRRFRQGDHVALFAPIRSYCLRYTTSLHLAATGIPVLAPGVTIASFTYEAPRTRARRRRIQRNSPIPALHGPTPLDGGERLGCTDHQRGCASTTCNGQRRQEGKAKEPWSSTRVRRRQMSRWPGGPGPDFPQRRLWQVTGSAPRPVGPEIVVDVSTRE